MKDGMLEIKDAPMFGRVMRDPDICKGVLERILDIPIGRIEYLNTEHVFDPATDARGVRLDVFAKDGRHVFDIEMQVATEAELGKRLRYYQASIDQACLDKGDDYGLLPESYIIFICDADPYGRGLPVYSIERICEESASVEIADASHWLVLNASAWDKARDKELSALLEYVFDGSVGEDGFVTKLDRAVSSVNADAVWRRNAMGFMTLEHDYRVRMRLAAKRGMEQGLEQGLEQGRKEGITEGLEQGESRYATLVDKLLEEKRFDDLKRSAEDAAFREQLLQELHLA